MRSRTDSDNEKARNAGNYFIKPRQQYNQGFGYAYVPPHESDSKPRRTLYSNSAGVTFNVLRIAANVLWPEDDCFKGADGNTISIEKTYNYMDEVFRAAYGEDADITCAMFNGDFSVSLEQAQHAKHEYILTRLRVGSGKRVLDIGCGWGPMLRALQQQGATGLGITLSTKQAEACWRNGLDARVSDWKHTDRASREVSDESPVLDRWRRFAPRKSSSQASRKKSTASSSHSVTSYCNRLGYTYKP